MATEERGREADKERAARENLGRGNMVSNVLATDSGKELFRHLYEICGFDQPSVVLDGKTGRLDMEKLLYNEARRSVYLQLRALAPIEELKKVEYKERTEEKT